MKKASEWFDELEPHVASRAKSYTQEHKIEKEYNNLFAALAYSFNWASTLEGSAFWTRIANSAVME